MGKICIIDGYNMIHRCRFEWGGGLVVDPNKIIYNFFRVLKSCVSQDDYDKVYFVTEGRPTHRLNIDENYKANRVSEDLSDEEIDYWTMFRVQKSVIIDAVSTLFPVVVVNHPDYEGDDTIYQLIKNKKDTDEVDIISSDTDFIQILNEYPDSVRLYNPISKKYRENTEYDYVAWKAMVGDKSDNIPGVPRIGKKTATKILLTDGELDRRKEDLNFLNAFNNSYSLIKLSEVDEKSMHYSGSEFLESDVRQWFSDMSFKFADDDSAWSKYAEPFNKLLEIR